MDSLDAATLLLVNLVFNVFAAAGWAVLGEVFRMAPRVSRLMVAAHLFRVLHLLAGDLAAGWHGAAAAAFQQGCALASVVLLALALRRLLRLGGGGRDIAALGLLGTGGLVLAAAAGWRDGVPLAASAAMALLAVSAARDLVSGAGAELKGAVTFLLTLPYLAIAGVMLARVVLLLQGAHDAPLLALGRAVGPELGGVWLVVTIAVSVSLMALLVRRLVGRVEHLTRRDPLTDTLNRRAIGEQMHRLQQLRARGHGFAVVLLDLDHFKRINDELGHAAGDAALLHVVGLVRGCLREADQFGRLGGEEFCLLLPQTSAGGAAQLAERIRTALQAQPLAWRDREWPMTASFGVTAGLAGDDPLGEATLARADQQVYRAKDEGRNRVCVAPQQAGAT